jgi:hyperosmotically inducible periplasmic protein
MLRTEVMNKLSVFLVSSVLLLNTLACDNVEKTSADAPDTLSETVQAPDLAAEQSIQKDGMSQVRRNQLNSDIRAREQRNNLNGGDIKKANRDLESEVRSKLEANIPAGRLMVDAKDGFVIVSGTVPYPQQVSKIEPLAKEIKGVQTVTVDVQVTASQ